MSKQVVNRELAEKQAEVSRLQVEEKKVRDELEASPEYKVLVARRFEVQEQVSTLRNSYESAKKKIVERVLTEGEYPHYVLRSSYVSGKDINIQPKVLEAIKEAGLPISHLKSSQIEEIAQFILDEELKDASGSLMEVSLKLNEVERQYEDMFGFDGLPRHGDSIPIVSLCRIPT